MGFKRFFLCMTVACAPWTMVQATPPPAGTVPETLAGHVPNLARPAENLLTGGQPDAAAWRLLEAQGVTTVINLRSEREMVGSDEAAQVRAAGMRYVHIPVAGAADVDRAHAARLRAAMAAASGKVLVHCASGNRAGALLAIDAADRRGLDTAQAIAWGRKAGLTSLQPRVREVLATPAPVPSMTECMAERLRDDVTPTHMREPWPRAERLPASLEETAGTRIADEQGVADGYRYTLFVDATAREAYVVQQGGITGRRQVFGPLPVDEACAGKAAVSR